MNESGYKVSNRDDLGCISCSSMIIIFIITRITSVIILVSTCSTTRISGPIVTRACAASGTTTTTSNISRCSPLPCIAAVRQTHTHVTVFCCHGNFQTT